MIDLKFHKTRENGDATAEYDVSFNGSFTVAEFTKDYLNNQNEWGYVSINGPFWGTDAKILFEFNRGNWYKVNGDLFASVWNKPVTKIHASGGWSRMDYELYVDLSDKEETNV